MSEVHLYEANCCEVANENITARSSALQVSSVKRMRNIAVFKLWSTSMHFASQVQPAPCAEKLDAKAKFEMVSNLILDPGHLTFPNLELFLRHAATNSSNDSNGYRATSLIRRAFMVVPGGGGGFS